MLRIKQHKFIWFVIILLGVILLGMPAAVYADDGQSNPEWADDEANFEDDDYDADSSAPPPVLGSLTEDFVYTPVNPCRIIDTRKAGGQIGSNSFRSFEVHGNVSGQGGYSGGCTAPRDEPRGVHINIVAVNSTAPGYLTVWPYGETRPTAGVLNYSPTAKTDPISNAFTVKTTYGSQAKYDISVYAKSQTHVVADVMGYYYDADPAGVDFVGGDQSVTLGAADTAVRTISMFLPHEGYVVVNASGYFYESSGTSTLRCSITQGTTIDTNALVFAVMDTAHVRTDNWGATRTFYIGSRGKQTFRVVCDAFFGAGTVNDVHMNAIFLPKLYF